MHYIYIYISVVTLRNGAFWTQPKELFSQICFKAIQIFLEQVILFYFHAFPLRFMCVYVTDSEIEWLTSKILQANYLVFVPSCWEKVLITWPQGTGPTGLCLLAKLSSLLGTWGTSLGECWQDQVVLAPATHEFWFLHGFCYKMALCHILVWWEAREIPNNLNNDPCIEKYIR